MEKMTDHALMGTYSDFKLVKTRSVVQVIIELPISEAKRVVDIMGMPNPAAEQWVGLALLQDPTKKRNPQSTRSWSDLKPSNQAALATKDNGFQEWVGTRGLGYPATEKGANAYVKDCCKIDSKSELDTNDTARAKWETLYGRYLSETGRIAEQH